MNHEIIPFPVRPWTLNGISERMLVSHHENDYGSAVRADSAWYAADGARAFRQA